MDKRQRAAAAAMAAVAAAGMVTGSVVESPAELLRDTESIVEDSDTQDTEMRRSTVSARIRRWLLSLPEAIRILVAIPLWGIGWILQSALTALLSASAPLVQHLTGWLCLALILLVIHTVSVKAAFPKVSLRRILRPGTVLFLLGMTAVLALADLALPTVWTGYDRISQVVWRIGSLCLLGCTCGSALKRHGCRAERQRAAIPKRTAAEEEARRLADTVCAPR